MCVCVCVRKLLLQKIESSSEKTEESLLFLRYPSWVDRAELIRPNQHLPLLGFNSRCSSLDMDALMDVPVGMVFRHPRGNPCPQSHLSINVVYSHRAVSKIDSSSSFPTRGCQRESFGTSQIGSCSSLSRCLSFSSTSAPECRIGSSNSYRFYLFGHRFEAGMSKKTSGHVVPIPALSQPSSSYISKLKRG